MKGERIGNFHWLFKIKKQKPNKERIQTN